MALSVNTNVTSLTVQKNLNKAGDALSTSMTRLSSGLKINSAKDDAAGLQMANRLTSQTKGMTVAIANANNGSSIAQTAEGAMQESTNILQRLRELALQASNGDKSDADRASLQQEFTAKTGELTRIAQTTTFGGRNILDGSFTNQSFQVGADANQTISFGMTDISATGLKGSYGEASVTGSKTTLKANVTGSAFKAESYGVTGTTFTAPEKDGTITIAGKDIALTKASKVATVADDINKLTKETGVTATVDTDKLVLTSDTTFNVSSSYAGTGLPQTDKAATKSEGLKDAAQININGTSIDLTKGAKLAEVITSINGDAGAVTAKTGVTASQQDGRLVLTSADGKPVNLSNGAGANGPGSLAKIGLSAGTTQPKLTADTSVTFNGVEVKFKKGDSMDNIVSSINSASTGVSASKNADNSLALFSTKDIKLGDGSAGTGLKSLGLNTVAATTNSNTVETTVSDLSILTAADSQRTIQALGDAIAQIDTQRAALGAVQNRFDSTVANLQSISENSTAALGRVQDTDFASEAAQLTKQQTLQQASTAILSQANQLPSAVMKLLQ
ncbi:flagellin N-terminal helical domain-containing protein [Pseudomonas helleri]|uniref:Flagellin n=1 Tax=Pseudomonas helleri TaxID=1608996 RepID=A0A7X1YE50_9PSED|nr:flagellin hook IN motif-containing protein [Pseudomonas helleri]MQT96750.1 flagellin [Pseudomonas helleri]MQU34258.1 flagellin [Pseudomonas helleri]